MHRGLDLGGHGSQLTRQPEGNQHANKTKHYWDSNNNKRKHCQDSNNNTNINNNHINNINNSSSSGPLTIDLTM
jgi:hypothetical protein